MFLICVNQLVCEAVNALLSREGIDLLGMETDAESGLAQVRALDPDIVLVEGDGAKIEITLMAALARNAGRCAAVSPTARTISSNVLLRAAPSVAAAPANSAPIFRNCRRDKCFAIRLPRDLILCLNRGANRRD